MFYLRTVINLTAGLLIGAGIVGLIDLAIKGKLRKIMTTPSRYLVRILQERVELNRREAKIGSLFATNVNAIDLTNSGVPAVAATAAIVAHERDIALLRAIKSWEQTLDAVTDEDGRIITSPRETAAMILAAYERQVGEVRCPALKNQLLGVFPDDQAAI